MASGLAHGTDLAGRHFQVIRREAVLPIAASDRAELARALGELHRTQGWHGQTALSFEQVAELVAGADGCRLRHLRTTLVVTVTLPQLEGRSARRSAAFERAWEQAVEGLRVHEDGHVDIGIDGAKTSHERLVAAGPFATCRDAKRALMREELRFRHRQDVLHERYDRRTRSGARQGAVVRAR